MNKTHTVSASLLQVLALLLIVSVLGCQRSGSVGIPMPKKIVDLSPLISEDLPVRQYGHRVCEFLGLKERIAFTPVVPQKEQYSFGLTVFEIPSSLGAHLDAPGRLLKGGERADQVPLEKLYGRARVIDLRWKDRHTALQITDLENFEIRAERDSDPVRRLRGTARRRLAGLLAAVRYRRQNGWRTRRSAPWQPTCRALAASAITPT